MAPVERLIVTLRLREGTQEQARELIAAGPPSIQRISASPDIRFHSATTW
jgi:hypothetical protein